MNLPTDLRTNTDVSRDTSLVSTFRACLLYKQAKPWQKPFLDPSRFLRNQLRKRGLSRGRAGQLRQVDAFHLPRFTVVNGETVSEGISSYGIYEENLTEAFLRLVEPGQVVVDIGMHLGYYTTLFARLVGEKGAVHSFEPTPSTREIAGRNVKQFANVTVHPFAVWSGVQQLTFHDYGPEWMAFNSFDCARMDSGPPPPKLFEVETITLDTFRADLSKPVAIVKVDAESAEPEILSGAVQLLRSDRPLVSLEVGDTGVERTSRRLVDLMRSYSYASWEFNNGRFVAHQPKERYDYDNLIFAPTGRDLSKA